VKPLERVFPRLFAPREPDRCGAVPWWEVRRIPYNVLIGAYGILCLVVFYWGIVTSGALRPGEDAVEPMALMAAPCLANACYTLGWMVEVLIDLAVGPSPQVGLFLFKLGLGFWFFVISAPAVYWGGWRALQLMQFGH
jgi:hypothetical protein